MDRKRSLPGGRDRPPARPVGNQEKTPMQDDVIDLSPLDTKRGAEAGFEVQILHPVTRKPLGLAIGVLGFESDAYQTKSRELRKRFTDQLTAARRAERTQEEIDAEVAELLAEVTTYWKPKNLSFLLNGKIDSYAFSAANARIVYARFRWLREQIDEKVHDRANFLPGSGGSS
jgi:hypothetical protein